MTNSKPVIAVVEDTPMILKMLERLLAAAGYETELYTSAEAYLRRDSDKQVDCLMLDINLDGMSGLELQRQLLAAGSTVPTIFLTGQNDDANIAQAIDMGCTAYLYKPIESRSLHSALNAALGSTDR